MKRSILIYIFLLLTFNVFSQTGSITGRVYNAENNDPLPFVNLIIDGTTIGSTTDLDGRFVFKGLKPGYVKLVATCIGFEKVVTPEFLVSNSKPFNIDIPMNETAINLGAIEVKAAAFERKEESPLSMRTLGIQEIEKSPGGNRDISKVLQSFPGVASTPAFRNDVIVRGGGSSENRFFLDDVEIPNLNHFATQGASGGPAGMINTDFLREVEFYSGAFTANRGNALSSIVDMKLIDGNRERINTKVTLGASDYGLSMEGPMGKSTTFLVSARRSYLGFLFSLLELPFLPTYNDFQVKARISLSPKDQLTVIGIGAIDNNRLNTAANKTDEQKYILSYIPVTDQWNYAVGVVYKHFRAHSYDTWVISRNMLNNRSYKYQNNDASVKENLLQDYNSDEIENKLRYENTIRKAGIKLNYGAGVEYARYTNSTFQKIFSGDSSTLLDYHTSMDLYKWNVFVQASRGFFGDRLNLSMGARADANSYNPEMSNMIEQLSPRISASYSFRKGWSVNGNVGRYTQQPPYTSLGYRNSEGQLINKINGIRYITADHGVLGISYTNENTFQISLEGFYKSYRHYPFSVADSISLASKGADFTTFGDEEVTPDSRGRAYGAEWLVRLKNLKGFSGLLSYTYVRSAFTGKTADYVPSAWDNRNLVNLILTKNFKHYWSIGIKWKYLGGGPYTPYDLQLSSLKQAWDLRGRAYLNYDLFNTARLAPYHQLDLRVDKDFYFRRWSLNFYVDIQNLYNSKAKGPDNYILATDAQGVPLTDPADPARYVLKAIPNETGSILPTLGISIQF